MCLMQWPKSRKLHILKNLNQLDLLPFISHLLEVFRDCYFTPNIYHYQDIKGRHCIISCKSLVDDNFHGVMYPGLLLAIKGSKTLGSCFRTANLRITSPLFAWFYLVTEVETPGTLRISLSSCHERALETVLECEHSHFEQTHFTGMVKYRTSHLHKTFQQFTK